jgi:hypothetical protein
MYEEEQIEPKFRKRPENPFRTPDRYFDSMEDRIMDGIKHSEKTKTKSSRLIHLMKPALSLVASFALVYLLVYYPINHFLPKNVVKTAQTETSNTDFPEAYSLSFASLDENSLFTTISSDDASSTSQINPDELLAYLSTGSNDIEIYSEIQN